VKRKKLIPPDRGEGGEEDNTEMGSSEAVSGMTTEKGEGTKEQNQF